MPSFVAVEMVRLRRVRAFLKRLGPGLVTGAAVVFGFTKHPTAAAVCASAPVGVLIYFTLFGFHPNAATGDKILQVIIALLWLRYSWRVLQIARAYPTMPEPETPEPNE